jgi:hypothetical protein
MSILRRMHPVIGASRSRLKGDRSEKDSCDRLRANSVAFGHGLPAPLHRTSALTIKGRFCRSYGNQCTVYRYIMNLAAPSARAGDSDSSAGCCAERNRLSVNCELAGSASASRLEANRFVEVVRASADHSLIAFYHRAAHAACSYETRPQTGQLSLPS